MKKLLIAYDGSSCAEAALEDLTQAGLPPLLEAVVFSVADVWLPAEPSGGTPAGTTMPQGIRKSREQAMEAIRHARAEAERAVERVRILFPGWKVEGLAVADSPAWGVLTKAAEWKADLILLGSHGRSTLERLFLGSVSQKVAAEAPCSVRIARPRKHHGRTEARILVAIDGSPDSVSAAGEVAARAWPTGTQVHLVSVMDPRLETAIVWPGDLVPAWFGPRDSTAEETITRALEHVAGSVRAAGWPVETRLLAGDAKHELLSHAHSWEADSIFIGARGLHHGGRLTMGTMASAITARAHCSVEIVRRCAATAGH